jgi:hypothetical protein
MLSWWSVARFHCRLQCSPWMGSTANERCPRVVWCIGGVPSLVAKATSLYTRTTPVLYVRVDLMVRPGARADLKVEVIKARKWLIDVAVVCPATKSVVARQRSHATHPRCVGEGWRGRQAEWSSARVCVGVGGGRGPSGIPRQEVRRRGGGRVVQPDQTSEARAGNVQDAAGRPLGIDLVHKQQAYVLWTS